MFTKKYVNHIIDESQTNKGNNRIIYIDNNGTKDYEIEIHTLDYNSKLELSA